MLKISEAHPTILVIGGTGTVGSKVTAGLATRGVDVRVLTHSADKLAAFPPSAVGVLGDLADPATLPAAFTGIDRLFLLTPASPVETSLGLHAVEAAVAARVERIVYLSLPMPPNSTHIPHFASKIPIERAIRESGLAYTILRPNNFAQNDLWFEEVIVRYGVYPQPIGDIGLSRVDVRDIAEAAITTLLEPGHDGQEYTLHGPDALSGEAVAEIWSRHLERAVRYGGDDLDTWEQQALRSLPDWLVHDWRVMYAYFQEHGLRASEVELARERALLGHEPRSFAAFASETAQQWPARQATPAR